MAQFWYQLRRNITMDGDLQLARLELAALVGQVADVIVLLSTDFPTLAVYTRDGQQGFASDSDEMLLPLLLERLTFVQRICVIVDDTTGARDMLRRMAFITSWRVVQDKLYVEGIPHYPLFEYAEVIARRAKDIATVRQQLVLLMDGLLGRRDDKATQKLIDGVMSAQMTTTPLSHGIHYYKAKFFPRMARSMVNSLVGQRDVSDLCVLDPFVGSGTTLLEASQLGIQSVGLDIDPLSVMISQAKLNVLEQDSQHLSDVLAQIGRGIAKQNDKHVTLPPMVFPDWLMKNRKMTDELAKGLIGEIDHLRGMVWMVDEPLRDIVKVILSDAITRRIKFRFLGTGVGRFSLTLSKTPLDVLFMRALRHQLHSLVAWEWLKERLDLSLAESHVHRGDARQLASDQVVDFIVTSPPYLPASSGRESYAKARMPSLLALDMVDTEAGDELVDMAVGSMDEQSEYDFPLLDDVQALVDWLAQDDLRHNKAQPTARYFADMRQTFKTMSHRLSSGGKIVLVSGRQSTFYRASTREILYCVPVAEMIAEEAKVTGLVVEQLLHIPLKKSNRNARPRSLDAYDETLIFLSKP